MVTNIAIGAEGFGFDSLARQTDPLRRFCVAQALCTGVLARTTHYTLREKTTGR